MNRLLYYPFTTVNNINFLRFALLYIENISTIIPENSFPTDKLSCKPDYRKIFDNTNLLSTYNPTPQDILITRNKFKNLTNVIEKNKFIQDELKKKYKYNNNIGMYDGKLDYELRNTLLNLNLACENTGDLLKVNPVIARLYMSMLAETICNNNNLEAITANPNQFYTDMSYITNNLNKSVNMSYIADNLNTSIDIPLKNLEVSKSIDIINIYVPNNLYDISIEKLIELRNNTYFSQLMSSFRFYVNEYLKLSPQSNLSFEEFIDIKNKDIIKDIKSNILHLGAKYLVKSSIPSFPTISDVIIDSIPDEKLSNSLKICKDIAEFTIDCNNSINTEERKKQTQLRHYLCHLSELKYQTSEYIREQEKLNKIINIHTFNANLY